MMKNQKGFVPVIIILVILVGFVGVYYLGRLKTQKIIESPTPTAVVSALPSSVATSKSATSDPTANWQVYTNSKYDFSFKYPQDWKVTLSPTTGEEFNLVVNKKNNSSETGFVPVQFSINMSTDENGVTKKITTLAQAEAVYKISSSQTKKDIFIDNKPAVTVTGLVEGPGPGTGQFLSYTFVKLNNEVIIIQLGNEDYQTIFDQILFTFKFTN